MALGFCTMGSSSLYRSVTKIRDDILFSSEVFCTRFVNLCNLQNVLRNFEIQISALNPTITLTPTVTLTLTQTLILT